MNSPVNAPVTTESAAVAYAAALDVIAAAEPDVAAAIAGELASQRRQLKLIASENYASPAVLLAMGNWLSDKYAEGTIGRRLYAGCEMVDRAESIAAGHARALFGADHAYVQPHSGIDANLVAFWAILARRVEAPALRAADVRHVNDLPAADWERLRRDPHSQPGPGSGRCARRPSGVSTACPPETGRGCGGTCIPSPCCEWRWTRAGTWPTGSGRTS